VLPRDTDRDLSPSFEVDTGVEPAPPAPGVAPTPPGQLLRPGEIFANRYRIVGVLDKGSMARVYLARQLPADRDVALKVLLARYSARSDLRDAMQAQGKALSRIQHPNVVTVYEIGVEPERVWIATEYLRGQTLRERLKRHGKLPLEEAVLVVTQAAAGVAASHAKDILHGDLKPENVVITEDGLVKVVDFLTAEFLSKVQDDTVHRQFTVATAEYMAPERSDRRARPDPRSDIYSLALVFIELVSGENPMVGQARHVPPELLAWRQHHHQPAMPVEVPRLLGQVLDRALAKDPRKRQATMRDFARELEAAYQRTLVLERDGPLVEPSERRAALQAAARGAALGVIGGMLAFAASKAFFPERPNPTRAAQVVVKASVHDSTKTPAPRATGSPAAPRPPEPSARPPF